MLHFIRVMSKQKTKRIQRDKNINRREKKINRKKENEKNKVTKSLIDMKTKKRRRKNNNKVHYRYFRAVSHSCDVLP